MSWHLARSLENLRDEINAKYPGRSKSSDGTIGDAAHSARASDHNPNSRRSVNAMDITTKDIDFKSVFEAIKKHPSARYVIHKSRIYNRDIGNWASRPYRGSNPHDKHFHISIYQSKSAEDNNKSWGIGKAAPSKPAPKPKPKPKPKPCSKSAPKFPYGSGHYIGRESNSKYSHSGANSKDKGNVRQWQQQMKGRGWSIGVDGYFGPQSEKVAKAFQQQIKVTVDGKVGAVTWEKSWTAPVT